MKPLFALIFLLSLPAVFARVRPGGKTDANLSDPQVLAAAQRAVAFLNANADPSSTGLGLVEVVAGTSQVVAGTRYQLTLRVAGTQCTAAGAAQRADCEVQPGAVPTEIDVSVWVRLWLPEPERYVVKVAGGAAS